MRPGRADEGFTLVELLMSMAFVAVVLAIGGTMILSGMRVQAQVAGTSGATGRGETVARSVEAGVRNSSSYLVGDPDSDGNQLLRARVAIGVAADSVSWICQAWYFDAIDQKVWTTSSSSAIADVTSPAQVQDWTLLADGIEQDLNAATNGGGGNSHIFSGSSTELRLQFVVTSGDVALVLVPSTVVQQLKVTGGTGPSTCF
jgi:hypothetical protein